MRGMRFRLIVVVLWFAAFVGGCATIPVGGPTSEERKSRAAEGAGEGALKGLKVASRVIDGMSGCSEIVCLAIGAGALVAFPTIGAMIGAATAEPEAVKAQDRPEVSNR